MATSHPVEPQLRRNLSLTLVIFYGIGSILGAGIYVLVGKVAGYAGIHTPLAFLLASVLAAFSAFSYAELSARYPKSAGEAVYVFEGLRSQMLSQGVGLAIVLAGIVSVATLVHGFVGYLKVFYPVSDVLTIVLLVVIMWGIVAWGISQSVLIAAVMTLVEIFGLLLIIWVARAGFGQLPQHAAQMVAPADATAWVGILLGSFVAFYAFIGFEDIVNVAEETRNPRRTLPIAVIVALLVTSAFYMLVAVVSILSMPAAQLADSDAPLALLYTHSSGGSPTVITLISLFSVLNGALIQIIMASRVLYGMGNQGWLPSALARVNATTRTPVNAAALVSLLVLLFALWLPILTLAKLTSFIILFIFILVNLSLFIIKRREAAPPSTFSIPIWVPLTGFVLCSAFVLFQLWLLVTR